MTTLSEQEVKVMEKAYSDNGFTGTFTLPEFKIAFEAGLNYNKARICDVCFTDSWRPCSAETPNAVPDSKTDGFMVCGYCSQQVRVEKLEAKVKELQEQLREELGIG